MTKRAKVIFQFCLMMFILVACASAKKGEIHRLDKIVLQNMHYKINSISFDSKLNCQPLKNLFKEIQLDEVRKCIGLANLVGSEVTVSYRFKREQTPFFELEHVDAAQNASDISFCFEKALPKLPVPREIYFQALEGEYLNCYSSRLTPAEEETLNLGQMFSKKRLKLTFPMKSLNRDDEEALLILGTWVISPFIEDRTIEGRIVPRSLCESCFASQGLILDAKSIPNFWP